MQKTYLKPQRFFLCIAFVIQALAHGVAYALEFQPGAGIGLEFTDNARLTPNDTADELIAITYVAASIVENNGPLTYRASSSLSQQHYTKGTFDDQQHFNLDAVVDWVMIRERFNWMASNRFSQAPVRSLEPNTPDNLQDTNVFTLAADINTRLSARHNINIVPSFSQYYYETLATDNKQYSLEANWQYQATRVTDLGFTVSARKVDYTETGLFARAIEDVKFLNAAITVRGQRARSTFDAAIGAAHVERDSGRETSGFTGQLNWLADVSARSTFSAGISSELTDTSTAGTSIAADTGNRSGDDVQVTTDVIRNSIIDLAYLRKDASLDTRISARYHKVAYSDSPLDRIIRDFGIEFRYPLSQLLTGSAYINHNRSKQLDTGRLDKALTVGGNVRYTFSRKMHGTFDIKYRERKSTDEPRNYNEFSVYVSLVYGFGNVTRPTRAGVF